jgi:hypothetical protein
VSAAPSRHLKRHAPTLHSGARGKPHGIKVVVVVVAIVWWSVSPNARARVEQVLTGEHVPAGRAHAETHWQRIGSRLDSMSTRSRGKDAILR